MGTLGKVADPASLDACERARAYLCVDVPAGWIAGGADLEITSPARLGCARCDGGGCDGCDRSGALRAPADPASRVIRASIPPTPGAPAGIALRIPDPFGEASPIGQIRLEIHAAAAPSPSVRRLAPPPAPARSPPLITPATVAILVAIAAALTALLTR